MANVRNATVDVGVWGLHLFRTLTHFLCCVPGSGTLGSFECSMYNGATFLGASTLRELSVLFLTLCLRTHVHSSQEQQDFLHVALGGCGGKKPETPC